MEVGERTLVENADSRTSPYPMSLGLEPVGELDCNELGGSPEGSGVRSILRRWERRGPALSHTPTDAVRLRTSHVAPRSRGSLPVIED